MTSGLETSSKINYTMIGYTLFIAFGDTGGSVSVGFDLFGCDLGLCLIFTFFILLDAILEFLLSHFDFC